MLSAAGAPVFSIFASRTCQMSGMAVKVTLDMRVSLESWSKGFISLLTMCLAGIGQGLDGPAA